MRLIKSCVALALLCTAIALADGERQDGRLLRRLEWTAPHGELPGTYAEYIRARPQFPAVFTAEVAAAPPSAAGAAVRDSATHLAILVDTALYDAIQPALSAYVTDLVAEGNSASVTTVTGGTPADIKAWVQAQLLAGSNGVLFIGDVTAAWAEVSGDVFPSDLYYMDLDGFWQDADQDGDFETHSAGAGDEGPEIYVARLYAHSLTYDDEAALVNAYFAKAHQYRVGTLTQPWRGLEYVDEDWFDMDVSLGLVYDDVARFDYGYYTTAADYLAQMDLGQHFVQVCAHSYSGGHHFGLRPTESATYAHVYIFSPVLRMARLKLGSDDGIKVWWNGANVLTRDVYQGWIADQFIVNLSLMAGWNRLLCKISQGGGAYQFSARLTDTAGADLPDLQYQLNNPGTHGTEAPFVRGWLLNGFHQDSPDNFWDYLTTNYLGVNEGGLNPQAGDVMGGHTWTSTGSTGPYVDLDAFSGGADYGVVYAFARVSADTAKSCQLWLGYDDGARVWLNGTQVLYDNRYGGYTGDMTKIDVTLNAGVNRLVVKVSEWMGSHGFSARFAHADGTAVTGLTYDPAPPTVSFIGTWLLSGPHLNPDQATRLSYDYLGGENSVMPSAGDGTPGGAWTPAYGSGQPFDLGLFYDSDGGWVFTEDVLNRDPPALFYNLFACGPGRFTDENYLAGAYIFGTTYGLITVASSKSGSMLNFADFTAPLGAGESVGAAFQSWFDAQAPFELWEREWYYGMVLNGDPTLRPTALARRGDLNCDRAVGFGDINAFVLRLSNPAGYAAAYPACPDVNGDVNGNGSVGFDDINPFVALLTD